MNTIICYAPGYCSGTYIIVNILSVICTKIDVMLYASSSYFITVIKMYDSIIMLKVVC